MLTIGKLGAGYTGMLYYFTILQLFCESKTILKSEVYFKIS